MEDNSFELEREYEDSAAGRAEWKAFARLLGKARVPWLFIGIAFVLSVLSAKLSVLFPDYSIKFFEEGDIARSTVMTGIGLLVLSAVASITLSYIEARLRTGIAMRLRDAVLEKILRLKRSETDRMNPRELISRTSNDTVMLSDFIVTVFLVLAGEVFNLFFAMQKIFGYSRALFAFQVAFIPLSILVHYIQGHFTYRYQYRVQLRLAHLTEYLSELLVNIPIIKIFTNEEKEIEDGTRRIDRYADIRVKSTLLDAVFAFIDEAVRLGARVFAILYGGYLVRKGTINIGTWIAYFILAEQVILNIDIITAQWTVLKGVQGAVSRTAEITGMEEESYEGEEIKEPEAPLIFDDFKLSLSGRSILKGVSTEIRRGRTVAIVGSSGSGKSTTLNALLRFYDAEDGRLLQGAQDVREAELAAYRRQFSYVFQEIEMFSGSLRENLCYGAGRDVSDEEIMRRCEQAGLSDFVGRQDAGLDSMLSEGGSNISGGELQRIGIVRALLRDPEMMVLDEATANLDAETERRIMDEIKNEFREKTLIIVAHRLGLIKDADRIIYMEDGRIEAEGTHDELLGCCEGYRRLWEAEQVV